MSARGVDRRNVVTGEADRPTNSVDVSEVATTDNFSLRKGVTMKRKIINKRTELSDLVGTCGKYGSLQCDGDGLIAIYNALQLLDFEDITLKEVNDVCIKRRAHWFWGIGWFKIRKIKRVLKDFEVKVKFKGVFNSFNQLTSSHKFILVYWNISEYIQFKDKLKFQAAHLVKDRLGMPWIETCNPCHRYDSPRALKRLEGAFMPLLFVLD